MGLLGVFWYGLLLSGAGWTMLRTIEFTDPYKVIHSNVPGPCKFVGGIEHGAEDAAMLPNGIAILSTGLTFQRPPEGEKAHPAALMTFDFSKPDSPAQVLKLSGFKGQLNPHGISVFTEGGKTYVYVINHPPFNEAPPADTVEKFLWDAKTKTLTHQKSFSDPEFLTLNDLIVVGVDKFYATNYLTMTSKIMRNVELLLFTLPLQNVVFYDGVNGTVVLSGMYGANGIEVSTDKKYLYVAEITKKRISSYRIETPSSLVPVDAISLGSLCDNLSVEPETGDIWIGCHPVGLTLFQSFYGTAKQSPSQVLRVGVKDGKFTSAAEIYADDGSVLSASTVAVPYKGSVLIGTVKHKALHCKLAGLNSILKLK